MNSLFWDFIPLSQKRSKYQTSHSNIRLMNEQARIAGMRASATKRFISFALDCLFYLLFVVVLDDIPGDTV